MNHLCHRDGTVEPLPVDARAATVSLQGQQAQLLSVGLAPAHNPIAKHLLSFSQTLDALPASLSWATKEIALPPDPCPIIASIQDDSACAISEGSFKDKFGAGTSAFTIVDARHARSILGLNIVPGHLDDQGAHHSKLAGLFAVILIENLVHSWAEITFSGNVDVMVCRLSTKPLTPDLWNLLILTSTCSALFAR